MLSVHSEPLNRNWSLKHECIIDFLLEFFIDVSVNSVTKILVIRVKGLGPATFCVREKLPLTGFEI